MYNCTVKMKIVVDTSVIIAVITSEKHRRLLIELTKGADLVAPASLHWEVGNAFSSLLKKRKMTLEQTLAALSSYDGIAIRFVEVGLRETLGLCAKTSLYAYDAYFIACALRLKAALLSLDKTLLFAAEQSGASVIRVQP